MLQREEELRWSEAVQQRFTAAEASGTSEWMDVAREVQQQVLKEFHYFPLVSLHALRLAAQQHPEIPMYIRENRKPSFFREICPRSIAYLELLITLRCHGRATR